MKVTVTSTFECQLFMNKLCFSFFAPVSNIKTLFFSTFFIFIHFLSRKLLHNYDFYGIMMQSYTKERYSP